MILVGSGVLASASYLILHYTAHFFTDYLEWIVLNFATIFIFSMATYFLQEKTFFAWKKLTLWWLIVSFFLIIISPTDDNFFGNIRENLTFIFSGVYVFVSIILIIYKSIKFRKQ
jgi:hypothetical protein